eukprot:48887_1
MGACCPIPNAESKEHETQSIGLSDKSSSQKDKHQRRNTSNKGITRLTMKFPLIRYSFASCKKVFDACCGSREGITKAEVKPLLIELGADGTHLTDTEIQRIIKTANLDGDDDIDLKEFLIAAAVGCFLNEDNIDHDKQSDEFKKVRKGFLVAKEAFDFIDDDGSGEIDFEELKKAFSAMKTGDDLIMERLKELDFDGDNTIEFPEFVWGITAWVGMDPDAEDDVNVSDFEDANTLVNTGDVLSPKHRLSVDNQNNPNNANANPTDT